MSLRGEDPPWWRLGALEGHFVDSKKTCFAEPLLLVYEESVARITTTTPQSRQRRRRFLRLSHSFYTLSSVGEAVTLVALVSCLAN